LEYEIDTLRAVEGIVPGRGVFKGHHSSISALLMPEAGFRSHGNRKNSGIGILRRHHNYRPILVRRKMVEANWNRKTIL